MAARNLLTQQLSNLHLEAREPARRLDARAEEPMVHGPDLDGHLAIADGRLGAAEASHAFYEVSRHYAVGTPGRTQIKKQHSTQRRRDTEEFSSVSLRLCVKCCCCFSLNSRNPI